MCAASSTASSACLSWTRTSSSVTLRQRSQRRSGTVAVNLGLPPHTPFQRLSLSTCHCRAAKTEGKYSEGKRSSLHVALSSQCAKYTVHGSPLLWCYEAPSSQL